jgi:Zn-dependent protease
MDILSNQMPDNFNQFQNPINETSLDIELLKKEVGQHFPFYDFRYNQDTAAFFCKIDKEVLEEKFNLLRSNLSKLGYTPMLRYEKGEHILYIKKKPKSKEKPIWINIILLVFTIITTILTGSILYLGSFDIWSMANPVKIFELGNLFYGTIFFAIPLMSILIVHEMGHYYISKKHGVSTSLPFFLPIPPVMPDFNIGTFGALIQSKDPMPNKKALFDIGLAGPLAGFLIAIPITIIGIATAKIIPVTPIETIQQGQTFFNSSLLIDFITLGIRSVPNGYTLEMNPILFAGWVGLLVTSINLFPAGQLDGGHIFRAVLGDKQKYAGWIAVFIMILTGWLFFAFIIIFLLGLSHPPPLNDDTKLDNKRKLLFLVAILILVLSYIPYPIYQI